jgi:hypothetical protein
MHTPVTRPALSRQVWHKDTKPTAHTRTTTGHHFLHATLATTVRAYLLHGSATATVPYTMQHTGPHMQGHWQHARQNILMCTRILLCKPQATCVYRLESTSHTECAHTDLPSSPQHAHTCGMIHHRTLSTASTQRHAHARAMRHVTCGAHPTPP